MYKYVIDKSYKFPINEVGFDTAKLVNQTLVNSFPNISSSSAFAAIKEDCAYAQIFRQEMQLLFVKLHRLHLSHVQVRKKKKAALKTNIDVNAASTTQAANHLSTINQSPYSVDIRGNEADDEESTDDVENQEEFYQIVKNISPSSRKRISIKDDNVSVYSDTDDEIPTSPHITRSTTKRKLARGRNSDCPDAKRKRKKFDYSKAKELLDSLFQSSKEKLKRQHLMDVVHKRECVLGVDNIQLSTKNPEKVELNLQKYAKEKPKKKPRCQKRTPAQEHAAYHIALSSIKLQSREEIIKSNRRDAIVHLKKYGSGIVESYPMPEEKHIASILHLIQFYNISPPEDLDIPDLFKFLTERISRRGVEISPEQLKNLMAQYDSSYLRADGTESVNSKKRLRSSAAKLADGTESGSSVTAKTPTKMSSSGTNTSSRRHLPLHSFVIRSPLGHDKHGDGTESGSSVIAKTPRRSPQGKPTIDG